jgi:hypothetical protein
MRGGDETPYSLQPRQHDVSYQRAKRSRKRNVCLSSAWRRASGVCASRAPVFGSPGTDACLSRATLLRGRSYINSLRLL